MSKKDNQGQIRMMVYGTLKDGQVNHDLLKGIEAEFVGYDRVVGKYKMVTLGPFPAVVDDPKAKKDTSIYGEIYAMNEEALAHIDFLEGHPNFFERQKVWTYNNVRVWIYLLGSHDLLLKDTGTPKKIPGGIWEPSFDERKHWERDSVC
jgi:gamma-glutamylcyclotransferase (GGCT)/AIG2-like uncharacterized protein YtfP